MKTELQIKFYQLLEFWQEQGLAGVFRIIRELFFWKAEIIVCCKDLTTFNFNGNMRLSNLSENLKIEHISTIEDYKNYKQIPSRLCKAKKFFNQGFSVIAAIRQDSIAGDLWYFQVYDEKNMPDHPHMKWFGFQLEIAFIYMFDMYIAANERGHGIEKLLLDHAFKFFAHQGSTKIYGSYRKDNLPALWMHRVAGYEEIFELQVRRILGFYKVSSILKHGQKTQE